MNWKGEITRATQNCDSIKKEKFYFIIIWTRKLSLDIQIEQTNAISKTIVYFKKGTLQVKDQTIRKAISITNTKYTVQDH